MTYYGRGDAGGVGLRKSDYPSKVYKVVKEQALSRMDGDIKELMKSLTSVNDRMSFYRLTTEHISRMLIFFCIGILREAVSRAPYRSGALRSSGMITIRTGQKQAETEAVRVQAGSDGAFSIVPMVDSIKRPAALITAEISFDRTDVRGEERIWQGRDVALWAHEELLGYEERGYRDMLVKHLGIMENAMGVPEGQRRTQIFIATKKGTGPKYLEGPYNEQIGRLEGKMQLALGQAITRYNRHTGQRVRRRS